MAEIATTEGTFPCHETTKFDDEGSFVEENEDEQHCAGALIFHEKSGVPNQMMRIAERLGLYDYTKLDMTSPVYSSLEEISSKFNAE